MKVVALGKAKDALSACIDEAQEDRILITRHGRPVALIVGVEGEEFEDLMTRSDPEFWRMIESRRRNSRTVPAAEMRRRLGMTKGPRRRRKR